AKKNLHRRINSKPAKPHSSMGLQYAHFLMPEKPDFVPQPEQVGNFIQELVTMGSAPSEIRLRLGKHNGRVRHGTNALTGERISIPVRDFVLLKDTSEISPALDSSDYDLVVSGKGPAQLPPFTVYATADGTGSRVYRHVCL